MCGKEPNQSFISSLRGQAETASVSTLNMVVARYSGTFVNTYQTIWRHIPEGSSFHDVSTSHIPVSRTKELHATTGRNYRVPLYPTGIRAYTVFIISTNKRVTRKSRKQQNNSETSLP
jgi:hypothetical protein